MTLRWTSPRSRGTKDSAISHCARPQTGSVSRALNEPPLLPVLSCQHIGKIIWGRGRELEAGREALTRPVGRRTTKRGSVGPLLGSGETARGESLTAPLPPHLTKQEDKDSVLVSYHHPYIILDLVYDRKAKIDVNSKPQINHLNYQLWEQNLHARIKERWETSGIPGVIWVDKGTNRHKLPAVLKSCTHKSLAAQQQDLHWDLCHSPLLSSTSPNLRGCSPCFLLLITARTRW